MAHAGVTKMRKHVVGRWEKGEAEQFEHYEKRWNWRRRAVRNSLICVVTEKCQPMLSLRAMSGSVAMQQ